MGRGGTVGGGELRCNLFIWFWAFAAAVAVAVAARATDGQRKVSKSAN